MTTEPPEMLDFAPGDDQAVVKPFKAKLPHDIPEADYAGFTLAIRLLGDAALRGRAQFVRGSGEDDLCLVFPVEGLGTTMSMQVKTWLEHDLQILREPRAGKRSRRLKRPKRPKRSESAGDIPFDELKVVILDLLSRERSVSLGEVVSKMEEWALLNDDAIDPRLRRSPEDKRLHRAMWDREDHHPLMMFTTAVPVKIGTLSRSLSEPLQEPTHVAMIADKDFLAKFAGQRLVVDVQADGVVPIGTVELDEAVDGPTRGTGAALAVVLDGEAGGVDNAWPDDLENAKEAMNDVPREVW